MNVNTTSVVSLEFNPVLEISPEEESTLEVRVREEGCWETESWAVALESGDVRMYIADAWKVRNICGGMLPNDELGPRVDRTGLT